VTTPAASVVIRAFNEERHIGTLLDLLEQQTLARDAEVIVVDSGSFDRTAEIVAAHPQVRMLRIAPEDFTFGYSLNVGIRAASAEAVAIVSAHTEPLDERWLETLVNGFSDPKLAMVYGRQVGVERSKFSERLDFERTFDLVPRRFDDRGPVFANNANAAVRRSLWAQAPFDERLPGLEDIAWARQWIARGYVVAYEPAAGIRHIHEESWPQVYHRYYREAVAAKQIGVRGGGDVLTELASELGRGVDDAVRAAKAGKLGERAGEIARFRWYKARGTVAGLMNGSRAASPQSAPDLYFDREYRKVVIQGPDRATMQRVIVHTPAPREVLVRVAYTGVCGTDLEILRGSLGYFKSGLSSFPITPGHEFSGWVARAGAKVEGLREGDPVVVECIQSCGACDQCARENWIGCAQRQEVGVMRRDGAYADFVTVPARFVHRLPDGTDMKRAALCEPLAVVIKGVRRLERLVAAPARCAVVGGGPIGYLAARLLQHKGCDVTVFDRHPARRAIFAAAGVPTEDALDRLGPYDAIVEATGDPGALDALLRHSGAGVAILLLGLPYARVESGFEQIVAFDKFVIGSVGSSAADFREAIALVPVLDFTPLTTAVRSLDAFASAWAEFGRRDHLKILLQAC
jgi:2-desacetyl-2-hydroxyethyl bacteriochlorophyllide A dehydrogenase